MATPTGQISLYDVRAELGRGGQISMGDSDVRQLAGRPSGQIAMSDLRGKSLNVSFPEQSWKGYNSFGRGYEWESTFSQGTASLRFRFYFYGQKYSNCNVTARCQVISGAIPKQIRLSIRAVSQSGEQTLATTYTFNGNTTMSDSHTQTYIGTVYVGSTFYARADLNF